jgi:hypothetical protein
MGMGMGMGMGMEMTITDHQAKYYAHELTIQHAAGGVDRLSRSLYDASVDLIYSH